MGLKKKMRTAEWHQQQVDQEVKLRVNMALKKKKIEGSKEEPKEEE